MANAPFLCLVWALSDPPPGIPGLPGGPEVSPPIYHPGHPDHGLPSRPPHVGNRPPGSGPGRPIDPGFGWGGGEHPGNRPPGSWGGRPVDPDWGLEEGSPDGGLPPTEPGVPAQPWVPPSGQEIPPPPDEIINEVVVAIWNPATQAWVVKTKPPLHPDQGLPRPPQPPTAQPKRR